MSLLILSSCGPSKEERAQEMAANYLKGVLYHFDSYEPLQTKIDSSFVALSTDKEAIELTLDMLKLFQSAQEYASKIERAESSMDIWSPSGYSSAYSKGEYAGLRKIEITTNNFWRRQRTELINNFQKLRAGNHIWKQRLLLR